MNHIGIIGAMEEEVAALKAKMQDVKVAHKAGMEFHQGTLKGKQTVIVRSGIGKVNAAMCTQILADDYKVDCIINTGIAGALNNELNIGDIVVSSNALQHDVDATVFGYAPGQIPRVETLAFAADEKLIELGTAACEKANPDIHTFVGRVISGDQFISDKQKKEWLTETFQGYCTEMEGAAIAQACWLNQIPFVIFRAISDKADNSAAMDYDVFEKQAIVHSVRLVEALLETI